MNTLMRLVVKLAILPLSLYCLPVPSSFSDTVPSANADGPDAVIPLADRIYMASRMYSDIGTYCAHFQSIPDFDLDKAYKDYLQEALKSDRRYDFNLASMAFVAQLHNGHSEFYDHWMRENYGKETGFRAEYLDDAWVITTSRLAALKPGDTIDKIDGIGVEQLFQQKKRYINASNERWARTLFFQRLFLFPAEFTVTTSRGAKVKIDRKIGSDNSNHETTARWIKPDSIACITIPGFDDPKFETKAIEMVKQYSGARSIIVDLRGNGGGSTPGDLIDCLMDRPYRYASQSTPLGFAVIKARAKFYDQMKEDKNTKHDELFGYLEAMKELSDNVQLTVPARPQKPEKPLFKGKLIVLIGPHVFSAGEDFCIPFKDNGRAIFVGETTGGSTGQPYLFNFANGSGFRVSAKRDSFPDGSPFEGIGIRPDFEVKRTAADIRSGRDTAMEKAIALCSGP